MVNKKIVNNFLFSFYDGFFSLILSTKINALKTGLL